MNKKNRYDTTILLIKLEESTTDAILERKQKQQKEKTCQLNHGITTKDAGKCKIKRPKQ